MAGIGSAWGSREEMLHPRDRHGRFRKKWKMAASVVDALSNFLDRFQPRSFQSDQQASQYAFNNRKVPWTTPELRRLHMDWDEANDSLQAGEMDDTTKKFVAMMDRNMVETSDDLIVSQTVPPEAFGMSAQQAQLEDGGLEDLIGLEIADAGYSATNLGSELSHPPGSVTLRVAVPKGTRVAYGGRSPNDRSVIFDRDQPLVVTKVEPDGRGGWYMLAIAGSGARTKGATAVASDRTHGRRGAGLTPEQREARITPRMSGEERLRIAQRESIARQQESLRDTVPVNNGDQPTPTPAPAAPASPQTPASPATGVQERQEPVLKETVGPGSPEGKSASDIAGDAETARVQAENAPPAPAAPPTPLEFQEASRSLPIPTSGPQRNEWNKAHRDLAQGRRDPGDVLRELDTDIEENKRKAATATHAEKKDSLERNIQAQEQLADLIAEKYGVQRQTSSAPVAKKAPTATPGAPSTDRGAAPKVAAPKPGKRAPTDVGDAVMKAGTSEEADGHLEGLTGAELKAVAEKVGAPTRARATKAEMRKAIVHQRQRQLDGEALDRVDIRPMNQREGAPAAPAKVAKKVAAPAPAKAVAKKAAPEAPAAPVKAVAKKATPAKAAPSPVDAEEEAFKARVTEAGLPDRVTALRAMAKEQKIRGFSTMNKKQLQQALLGDTVNTSNKIGVVSPAKMIPHLEAAESDQAARALLEKHTLVDLKALAKERGIKLPSRGATKGKVTDMVLEDIRGPQEGIGGRTPDTSLEEDLGQLGYIDLPGDNGNQIKQQIAQVDGDDADSLRQRRDDLEKLSKQFRSDGDKNSANMAQAAADAMGMRAQTISGVEEGAPPVKRVAKKAVPAVDVNAEPEPKTLDKMLKPELEELARKEGVPGIRKSMTKTQIREAIERNRRMDSSRRPETDEERQRRELGQLPGGAERLQGPAAGPLRLPDRAPTPEEIARDATPEAPVAPVKKATKKAAKKAVADVDRAAGGLAAQVRSTPAGTGETFGDILRQTDAEELRQEVKRAGLGDIEGKTAEEIFDNTIKKALEDRMRELGMLPEDPKKPTRAQKRVPKGSVPGRAITTPDRKQSFREAWDGQKFQATGAAQRSMDEIRDDIESGKISPEEGVRRLDSEISFNEDEVNDILAELDGMEPDDRKNSDLNLRGAQLEESVRAQKKAKTFIRSHFKDEAPVTRQELEIQLDGPEKAALDRVEVDDLKAAAKAEGLGNIDGDDKDTVIQNIAKAVAGRELANRDKERKAQDRQARIDDVRGTHDALAQLDQMAQNEGSDKALQAGIKRLPEADRTRLTDALGDREQFRRELDAITQEHGLTRTGHVGDTVAYDPQVHDVVGDIDRGSPVMITRAGHSFDPGNGVVSFKARAIPDPGGTIGPRKAAPSAPEATGISTPGQPPVKAAPGTAAGRITTARLTPGIRIMVQPGSTEGLVMPTTKKTGAIPVTVTKVEGVAGRSKGMYRVTVTDDNGNELDLGSRGASQTHMLEPPPKAPKATKAAAPSAPEAPTAPAPKKAAKFLPPLKDGTQRKSFTNVEVGDVVQRAGARQGPAKRVTKVERGPGGIDLTFEDGTRVNGNPNTAAWMGRDIPSAPEAPATPAKKVAKAAVPAKATPKPVVDLDNPTRHNAELIGTGLDLDPDGQDRGWLREVQSDLDAGTDGRQIADALRRAADSQRTIHNIQEASGGTAGASPEARINRMELMADRLEGVRPLKATAPAPVKAATKATKKAAPKKARPSVADDAVATLLMDRIQERNPAVAKAVLAEISPEDRKELDAARERDTARKAAKVAAPKKRTAAEMRRARSASENEGVPVEQILERWDGQKEDRKNLTGPVGEMVAQMIDDAVQRATAAPDELRASHELQTLPHSEMRTLADRVGVSRSGTKAQLGQRIAARMRGSEAPTTSAERAVPKAEVPSGAGAGPLVSSKTSQPEKPHSWGTFGQRGDQHYYHPDGLIPRTMSRLGDDSQIDVGGGESLHNAMGDIATDMVMGRISGDAGVLRLKNLATGLPPGRARTTLEDLVKELDTPAVPQPKLPDDTPGPVRRLLQEVRAFPIARATGHFGSSTYEKSLVDKIADFIREKASGESSIVGMNDSLARLILNHTHESQEGSMGLRALTQPLFKDDSEISQALLAWAKEIRARRRAT